MKARPSDQAHALWVTWMPCRKCGAPAPILECARSLPSKCCYSTPNAASPRTGPARSVRIEPTHTPFQLDDPDGEPKL